MRIFLETLKKFAKVVKSSIEIGLQASENIYIDFQNQYFCFNNSVLQGKVKFAYEGEKPENFFVLTSDFLSLCNSYDYLDIEIDGKKVIFKHEKNTFQLAQYRQKYSEVDYKVSGEDIKLPENFYDMLKKAQSFTSSDDPVCDGVYLRNNSMFSSTKLTFFEADLDLSCDKEIGLPNKLVKLLISMPDYEDSHTLSSDDNKIRFSVLGEFELLFAKNINLVFPIDLKSPEQVKKYDHKTQIVFDRDVLLNTLKFFDSFVENIKNTIIHLSIAENIIFTSQGDSLIKKMCPCESFSDDLAGGSIKLSHSVFKDAVSALAHEKGKNYKVVVQLRTDMPSINISLDADKSIHVVFKQYK